MTHVLHRADVSCPVHSPERCTHGLVWDVALIDEMSLITDISLCLTRAHMVTHMRHRPPESINLAGSRERLRAYVGKYLTAAGSSKQAVVHGSIEWLKAQHPEVDDQRASVVAEDWTDQLADDLPAGPLG